MVHSVTHPNDTMAFYTHQVVIKKSLKSRGFYVKVPNDTSGSFFNRRYVDMVPKPYKLEFTNYNDEPMTQWDYYWTSLANET